MSIFNSTYLPQSLVLAGSLSLISGTALAQPTQPEQTDIPQGRAGTATLCIEKRSYVDVNTKTIVTPVIYFDKIPDEGINTGYVEGNALAESWKSLLNPTDQKKKAWMDDTDIPTQFQDGVDVLKKLDKNKDGIVSKEEFEKGEKGLSEADQKTDLGLLAALACSGKYLSEGALNTVDVEQFPEMIQVRTELFQAKEELTATKIQARKDLNAAEEKFKTLAMVSGIGGGLLFIGLVAALVRGRKSGTPAAPKKAEPKKEVKPAPAPAKAADEDLDMTDAIEELNKAKDEPKTAPTPPPLPPEV